jgi:hypothetical protein
MPNPIIHSNRILPEKSNLKAESRHLKTGFNIFCNSRKNSCFEKRKSNFHPSNNEKSAIDEEENCNSLNVGLH